jgi:ketosteroid isomerase-like protein
MIEHLARRKQMSTQENVQVVKEGYAAFSRGDIPGLLKLFAEDVEWQIPGAGLPLAGTYRGHDGVANFFQKLAAEVDFLDFQAREFLADGDRVLVVGWERVKIKATNRTVDLDWIMSFSVRNGKVATFREFMDTKAIADAYGLAARAVG